MGDRYLPQNVVREDRADGSILLTSAYPLGPVVETTGDWLHRWAGETPDRVFIAERDGRPVGRIAAIRNGLHNEFHKDKVGFFGFFETERNPDTARALIDAAGDWLREQGCAVWQH